MSDKYQARKLESCWLRPIRASVVRLLDPQQMNGFRLVSLLVPLCDSGPPIQSTIGRNLTSKGVTKCHAILLERKLGCAGSLDGSQWADLAVHIPQAVLWRVKNTLCETLCRANRIGRCASAAPVDERTAA